MARRVQKRDVPFFRANVVRTDMLGNTSGLARCNPRGADVIQQRRLTMVYVAHYRDHWRPRLRFALGAGHGSLEKLLLDLGSLDGLGNMPQLLHN